MAIVTRCCLAFRPYSVAVAFALAMLFGQGGANALDTDFAFPAEVAGFQRGPRRDYEPGAPGLGYSYVYRSAEGRSTADVYVYDGRLSGIPDGPDSPVVRAQFAQAAGDIAAMAQQGRYREARELGAVRVAGPGGDRLRCGRWAIVAANGEALDSVLCLTGARGKFVKFRISGQDGGAAERFLVGWIPNL